MLVSKSFLVFGNCKTIDGKSVRNIVQKVDEKLADFHKENPGDLVSLQSNFTYGGLTGEDMVFMTITVNNKEEGEDSGIEGETSEPKRRGRPPKDS